MVSAFKAAGESGSQVRLGKGHGPDLCCGCNGQLPRVQIAISQLGLQHLGMSDKFTDLTPCAPLTSSSLELKPLFLPAALAR